MGVYHATSGGANDPFLMGSTRKTQRANSSGSTSGTSGTSGGSSTAQEILQIGSQMTFMIGRMLGGTQSGGSTGRPAQTVNASRNANTPGNVNTPGNTSGTDAPNTSGNQGGSDGNTELTTTMKKISIFSAYDDNTNSKLEYSDKKTAGHFEGKQLSSEKFTSNSQLKQLSSGIQGQISESITQKLGAMWQNSITSFSKDYQSQEIEVEYKDNQITEKGQKAQEAAEKTLTSSTLETLNQSITEINQQIQTDIQQALQTAINDAKQQQIDSGSIELNGQTYKKVEGEENKFTCNGQTYTYDGNNMVPDKSADNGGDNLSLSNDKTQYTADDASIVITRAFDSNAFNNMDSDTRQKAEDLIYDYLDDNESATLADIQQHLADNGIDPKSFSKSRSMDMSKVDTDALYKNADGSNMTVRDDIGSGKPGSMDDFILRDEMALRRNEAQQRTHRGELRSNERTLRTPDGGMGIEADLNDFKPDSKYDKPYTASLLNYKGADGVSYMNTVIKGKNGDVLVECKGGQLLDAQGNRIKQNQAEEILKNAHESGQLSKLLTYT